MKLFYAPLLLRKIQGGFCMAKKDLFDGIHECDDKWIEEVAEQEKSGHQNVRKKCFFSISYPISALEE